MKGKSSLGLWAYFLASLFCLTWPGYEWFGGRIRPFILGLPFSFAWAIGWVILTFLVLLCYYLLAERETGKKAR